MNIHKSIKQKLFESHEDETNRLVESYQRSKGINQFLAENGNTEENIILYNFMSLNESQNEANRFTFENGMFIPGLGSKAKGRLTLNNIAESAFSTDDYIEKVSSIICEDKLMFKPTETDLLNLKENYNEVKKSQML